MALAPYSPERGRTSFLPSIICSGCGQEIEIAKMGEHNCGATAESEMHGARESHSHNPFVLDGLSAQMPPMPPLEPQNGFSSHWHQPNEPYGNSVNPQQLSKDPYSGTHSQQHQPYEPYQQSHDPYQHPHAPYQQPHDPYQQPHEPHQQSHDPYQQVPDPYQQPEFSHQPDNVPHSLDPYSRSQDPPHQQQNPYQQSYEPLPAPQNPYQYNGNHQSPTGMPESSFAPYSPPEHSLQQAQASPRDTDNSALPSQQEPQIYQQPANSFQQPRRPSQSTQHPSVPRVRAPTLESKSRDANRPPRLTLPRINPEVANRPYLAPRTPTDNPLSPALSTRSGISASGRPGIKRSQSSPKPRLWEPRPPSEEISANLDCAFPPFPLPSKKERRPSASQGRKTPVSNDRAPSRATSRLDQVMTAAPEPFEMPPQSPIKTSAGLNVLKKLTSIRAGPHSGPRRAGNGDSESDGPTHSGRRPSASASDAPRVHRAESTRAPASPDVAPEHTGGDAYSTAQNESFVHHGNRLRDELSQPPFPSDISAEPASAGTYEEPSFMLPTNFAKPPSPNGPRELAIRPPRNDSIADVNLPHQIQSLPPRGDSRNATRIDYRMENAPPVPKPSPQEIPNSRHSPSHSGSSTSSAHHSELHSSSTMSPAGSAASSVEEFSPLSSVHPQFEDSLQSPPKSTAAPPRRPTPPNQEISRPAPGPRNFARPAPPRDIAAPIPSIGEAMESPMDPAMQGTAAPGSGPWDPTEPVNPRPFPTRTQTEPGRVPQSDLSAPQAPARAMTSATGAVDQTQLQPSVSRVAVGENQPRDASAEDLPAVSVAAAHAAPPLPLQRTPTRRLTIGKTACRGCHKPIEGKSVKAADGRLTGRWHKACFVCRTCREPFTTADFYVINNEPYCEHHYHETNGSLCTGCNRGIEGQYTETVSSTRIGTARKKYHPRCFTCRECRVVLTDDYFEIQGSVFCERHALAAMRAQARMAGPGAGPADRRGLKAERRTTKLMMMNVAA